MEQMLQDFSLNEVKVNDAYIKNALEKELAYLKAFDADRLTAEFLKVNNIRPKAEKYGGWEATEIRGHSLGHYMTAISQAVAQTGDTELRKKLGYIIDELFKAQQKNGYLSAFPETFFDNVENKKPCWVPWYTMDKILSGLTAAYAKAGNKKALEIASKLADWIYERTSKWTTETQNIVLAVEYGGMNGALYDLYKITKKEEHAKAAHMFDEMPLFQAIHNGHDILNGKHANTTIPKFLGALYRYISLGYQKKDKFYFEAAEKFWEIVVRNHTYITGGNSEWEHFGEAGILDAERTNCNCETCNTYNMLKLSRELFKITHEKKYLDFYENTFLNAILSSQNPETGMSMYFQPMATGYFKVYSTPFDSFWCCTGTGMENFTKCNDSIYFKTEDTVYVSQYLSSELDWKEEGFLMIQESDIPNTEKTIFRIIKGSKKLALRVPDWTETMTVKAGEIVKTAQNGYIFLEALEGMEIEARIPMRVRAYPLHDNKHCIGLKYGPVVLSAGLGMEAMEESKTGVDVTIATKNISIKDFITIKASDGSEYSTEKDVDAWISDIDKNVVKISEKLEFSFRGTDSDGLIFTPHYKKYRERYGIYWNMVSRDSKALQNHIREAKEHARQERVQIDSIPLGNDQYELLHNIQGENTGAGTFNGLMLRHAWSDQGWFSYDMKVKQGTKNYLSVKYFSGNAGRTFNIYIDDILLKEETIENRVADEFYEERYLLPDKLVEGKTAICVKFAACNNTMCNSWVGGIFDKLNIAGDYMDYAGIAGMNISGGTLSPAFCENITEYIFNMETEDICFQAELADKNGLLYVNDVLVDDTQKRKERLQKGDILTLRAVAEDFETEKFIL